MSRILNEIIVIVKAIKEKNGINQKELAKRLGYTETYLSDVLGGKVKLTEKFYKNLKNEYGKDFEEVKIGTVESKIAQLQAMLVALQEDYISHLAKTEGISPEEIRTRLMTRTIENLSKQIGS